MLYVRLLLTDWQRILLLCPCVLPVLLLTVTFCSLVSHLGFGLLALFSKLKDSNGMLNLWPIGFSLLLIRSFAVTVYDLLHNLYILALSAMCQKIPGGVITVWQICCSDWKVVSLTDKDTECTTNLSASGAVHEYDVITMTCSITYSGNWAPVMRWFNSVTRHNYTDDNSVSTTANYKTITSQLTVTASADLISSEIVCVTSFEKPSTSLLSNATTNVPSYTYTWTSPMLNVVLRCKCNPLKLCSEQIAVKSSLK